MKVRVAYTIEVDDFYRREINAFYGQPGLASREAVQRWFEQYGKSMNDDLAQAAQDREERELDRQP